MPGGNNIGAAFAAAAAARNEMMVCPDPFCAVQWKGRQDPCWVCGRTGVPLYPKPEEKSHADDRTD